MTSSEAKSAEEYLAELPPDRRAVLARVRAVILEHLPDGFEEAMNWGMISYEIPLKTYPQTYNDRPLMYAALAAHKRHYAVYLMGAYADPAVEAQLQADFEKAGRKLDMGKSCLRFRKLGDLPLEAIGRAVAAKSVADYIAAYEESRSSGRRSRRRQPENS